MYATGRDCNLDVTEQVTRGQLADNEKRETRKSLMDVVAKACDVTVKKAPFSRVDGLSGRLPNTMFSYHEKISLKSA